MKKQYSFELVGRIEHSCFEQQRIISLISDSTEKFSGFTHWLGWERTTDVRR